MIDRNNDMLVCRASSTSAPQTVCVPKYAWASHDIKLENGDHLECWLAGQISSLNELAELVSSRNTEELNLFLKREQKAFGVIMRFDDYLFAACDRVQSYPIFWEQCRGGLVVSADPRYFRSEHYRGRLCTKLLPLFKASGYSLGSNTMVQGVKRIRPGESIIHDGGGDVVSERYYLYMPHFSENSEASKSLRDELGDVLDEIVTSLISDADGRPIVLPLSAGFDSRLLLGKLVEHGAADNLITFSYGAPGNMEAGEAKKFADQVGASWFFVAPDKSDVEEYKCGELREYLRFSGGIHTTSAVTEYFALKKMAENGYAGDQVLYINGQSGDFLTGGHLFVEPDIDAYLDRIMAKHFGLLTVGAASPIRKEFKKVLLGWAGENDIAEANQEGFLPHRFHLLFEWQERQSTYVVNQQRAYDWFGIQWSLPLWHPKLMDFYERVPLEGQIKQKLYMDYLRHWNFKGLFDSMRAPYLSLIHI